MGDKFPVMLASQSKFIDRIHFPCYAQVKMDGMRALIVVHNGITIVYSRNGKIMAGLGEHFKSIVTKHDNMVYDGELIVLGANNKPLDRKSGNGILHKAVVNTISDEEIKRIRITLWDLIPFDDWKNNFCATPYNTRLGTLKHIPETNLHSIIKTYDINSLDEAQTLFKTMLDNGEEGIILKNNDHPWENKRSLQMIKMKEVKEIDLKVVDWVKGKGKYVGMLGALQCENKDGSIKVDVGIGYVDEQRKKFTKEYSVGKIISVQYNAVITRKDKDVKSLFLPVFVEFRPDKEESD